jgi:DNA-binding NarL/FixJ family response regulator
MNLKNNRLLIVDDSLLIVKRLTTTLHEVLPSTEIISVLRGNDAMAVMEKSMPQTVLLDLQLPDITGIEVLKKIKKQYPTAAVVVLTNNSVPYNRTTCIKEGAEGFYDKSSEFEKAIDHLVTLQYENRI